MSELGKVEERRSTDMGVYHLLCKAGNGLRPGILPWEPRECTLGEIKSSIAEPGKVLPRPCNSGGEKPMTSVMW